MILGTISTVDNDNGLQLIIDGEDTPTTKKYTYMSSYVPAANDRVLIEEIGGSYVIVGKVISDFTESGIARSADVSASCTGNAASATTAAACTGNAATATTAAACTGNAATATVSNTTKGFDSSVNSVYGQIVTGFTRTYNSTIGDYIVTDIQLGPYSKQYFVYK